MLILNAFLNCALAGNSSLLCIISSGADIRLWDYLSYCLSLLPFTEKCMKRLMESFKAYEHVLSEDIVMDHFRTIINKVTLKLDSHN